MSSIYLIPNLISDTSPAQVIPDDVRQIAISLKHFVVENEKVSRRFLKKLNRSVDIDTISFYPMGKHSSPEDLSDAITAAKAGNSVGVISDAGCPGVADPGAKFIALAHNAGLQVVPLVGPSSILLALMAAGMNGQHFSFHGYAPKEKDARARFLKQLSSQINGDKSSHVFMDTPFRNQALLETIIAVCPSNLRLSVARDITGPSELIITRPIAGWRKTRKLPDLKKLPSLFTLGH